MQAAPAAVSGAALGNPGGASAHQQQSPAKPAWGGPVGRGAGTVFNAALRDATQGQGGRPGVAPGGGRGSSSGTRHAGQGRGAVWRQGRQMRLQQGQVQLWVAGAAAAAAACLGRQQGPHLACQIGERGRMVAGEADEAALAQQLLWRMPVA
jgi:hypothetical protein